MATDPSLDGNGGLPLEALKRADALLALRNGPASRADLMETLGVSRTTVHRLVRALEAEDIIAQDGNEFRLTAFGRTVTDEVSTYRRRVSAASRIQPFLETVEDPPAQIGLFADATVTETAPTDPYAPVARFMELLRGSNTLRGFDTTSIAPVFVPEIRDEILNGMDTNVIYLPSVVESIVENHSEDVADAIDRGSLTLSTHSDLPFGLAIFDDRIGLGGYDEDTGILKVFVDTDDEQAREWALEQFEAYHEEARAIDEAGFVDA